jgi:predicted O-methyltransferase YrrM
VESRLKPGAFIVADNADYSPEYLKRVLVRERLPVCAFRGRHRASMRMA